MLHIEKQTELNAQRSIINKQASSFMLKSTKIDNQQNKRYGTTQI